MNELKVIEVNNTAYRGIKSKLIVYRRRNAYLMAACILFIVSIVLLGITCLRLNGENIKNDAIISELQSKVSVLEGSVSLNSIAISDQETTIDSLLAVNEYTNEKVISMQYMINELNDYIDINVIKLEATPHLDLATNTEMDTDTMNQIIDHFAEKNNTRFKGHGQAFIEASKKTGLNPVFILSIACLESGYGTSKIAVSKNNFMGIGAYDCSPYESSYTLGDDIDNGIINGAIWIKENYYDKGQTTLHDMIYGPKMYSSSKDHWINSICKLMNTSYKVAVKSTEK